ncbi:poly(A) polymerase [Devosia subaequoris]|uniref:Poly(A) polymerase n=1 Tax=Devosia subaequoris TaxID=395930 RepID=A0A7W6ILP6_9HYPH|nr:CCA tRNA nucleotidyltransferase [Devosia subaequoris]MBB4051889.1 poly(A) polymerase [Devosia subaequoris]MCP1210056.1 CCA tRNA nucleotidyltransferase [Devosia subaequoris]
MIPDRLEGAEWLERPQVQTILAALDGATGKTRAVGGVVRDSLIGRMREHADIDMATELLPVAVMQRAKASGITAYPTGIEHGTVTLRLDETTVEVTTLRQDVVTNGRHAEVAFGTDWVADAERRDFTLNALYCFADGRLFDPLGGAGDLINGRVRFIGDAAQRIAEDGLRVYRFFRFSASHGGEQFDVDGLAACKEAAEELEHISRERVGAEMLRMLALPRVATTLALMDRLGLVRLAAGSVAALQRYEALGGQNAAARLAMLGRDDLAQRQADWRLSKALIAQAHHIEEAAAMLRRGDTGWAAYRFGEDAVEGLAVAAAEENWPPEQLAELARDMGRLPVAPLPVGGADLAARGMKPGPDMGAALAIMERAWVESGFCLSKDALLERIFH